MSEEKATAAAKPRPTKLDSALEGHAIESRNLARARQSVERDRTSLRFAERELEKAVEREAIAWTALTEARAEVANDAQHR